MHWIWIWLLSFLITLCYMWNKWLVNVIHKNILSKLQQLHRIKYSGIINHILYILGRWFTPHKHFSTYNDHTPKQKMRECVWSHAMKTGLSAPFFWQIYILKTYDSVFQQISSFSTAEINFSSHKQEQFQRNDPMVVKQISATNWLIYQMNTKNVNWRSRSTKM